MEEYIYFRERCSSSDFFHTLNQGAEVLGGNARITDELDKVVDDNDGSTLDLHAAIVESSLQQWHKNGKGGRRDFRDERLVGERLDAGWDSVRLSHTLDKSANMRCEIGISQSRAQVGSTFDGGTGDLAMIRNFNKAPPH